MNRGRIFKIILLLIIVLFISLLSLTGAPYGHSLPKTGQEWNVSGTAAFQIARSFSVKGSEPLGLLNQTTRMEIYDFVAGNPGMHFRALSYYLNMPIGVLQYHLGLLVNGGLLVARRDGRYQRYFAAKKFTETEMSVISMLRHPTSGKILIALLDKSETTRKELSAQIGISSQALSWQMNHLEKTGFVKRTLEESTVQYSLDDVVHAVVSQYAMLQEA